MGELLSQISALLPVFLASPTMWAGSLVILGSASHPRKRAVAALLGSFAVVLVMGNLVVMGEDAATAPREPTDLSAGIDLVLALLLIMLGLRRFMKKEEDKPTKQGKVRGWLTSERPQMLKFAVFGMILTVTNPTSLAAYIAAGKLVVDSGLESSAKVASMSVAALYFTLPILVPLAIAVAAPASSTKVLAAMNRWLKKYSRIVVAAVLIVFGAYLAVKGLRILSA